MAYAIIAETPGDSTCLKQVELIPPDPGPGEVRIRQTAIGVNFIDVYIRSGLYPWPVERDLILGSEGAGVIEALGAGVEGFQVGERVAYTVANGAYATHRLVPAAHLLHLPDGISDEVAAAAILKGLTSYYLLHDSFAVQRGQTVLFHAAAGGVGLLAGQWLNALGVQAIGTAGGATKCDLARAHGYSDVIDYRSEDFAGRIKDLTDGKGVPVVYDSVGKDTNPGSLDCLSPMGTLVSFGQSSGPASDFKISDLARGSLYVQRPVLYHYTASRPWLDRAAQALFDIIESGQVKIAIGATRPLKDVAQVHDDLEARKTTGSTILIP